MFLLEKEVPVRHNGKWYITTPTLVSVKGGKNVVYITSDGTELKREPLHRYKNRISRRKNITESVSNKERRY